MEKLIAIFKKHLISIIFALLFVLMLVLWLVSLYNLSAERIEAKASKQQIKLLQSEIKQAQKEFKDIKNQIENNEKNRPTANDNSDATLDDLLRKMQDRFNGQQARGLLD